MGYPEMKAIHRLEKTTTAFLIGRTVGRDIVDVWTAYEFPSYSPDVGYQRVLASAIGGDKASARANLMEMLCEVSDSTSDPRKLDLHLRGIVHAYLVVWSKDGEPSYAQISSEFPMTQLSGMTPPEQRVLALSLGKDFDAANQAMQRMLDRVDPKLRSELSL